MSPRFYFNPVDQANRLLVHSWLKLPHVAKWFYGQGLENTLNHLDDFLRGSSQGQYWLGFDQNRPFSFLITSSVTKPSDPLTKWCSKPGEAITIDLLIGDTDYLGKGLSHLIIQEFLNSRFPHIAEVLIDPETTNSHAIHIYKKVGFTVLGEFIPSHSPHLHYMMHLDMKKLKIEESKENKYVFDPYDETFPALFLAEKTRILAQISKGLQIEHVGSTAVPGLGGKRIIDIAILVKEADMMTVSNSLQQLGYEFRPSYSTKERLYFVAFLPDPAKGTRRYHIHLTYPGSPIWEELVGLRDYLIHHPEAKQEYAAIKEQSVQNHQESKEYREAKDPFLQKTLQKIRAQSKSLKIFIRDFQPEDVVALADIYFNTIHHINKEDYSQQQLDAWAPKTSLETEGWSKKFARTLPLVAVVDDQIVGFAEFEPNGHIDCFYCHHEWTRKGVGSALMQEIFNRAHSNNLPRIFVEVSITARPFFETQGFVVICEQSVVIRGVTLKNYKMEKTL